MFEEINATMSEVTTVPSTQANVRATYELVKQAMPTEENIEGFVASQQTGVAQLAIEYCAALVDDTTLRAAYFPGMNFGEGATTHSARRRSATWCSTRCSTDAWAVNVATQPNRPRRGPNSMAAAR